MKLRMGNQDGAGSWDGGLWREASLTEGPGTSGRCVGSGWNSQEHGAEE